ncbi:MAG: GNAT family N-acetyltransferase [Bacteroidetes bacterium]|nr:GNAT family N-acetyltransferase [Bacteroidota bacterium]
MRKYKCLGQNSWHIGEYKLTPIRDEDKYLIMNWRNDQIDILRQKHLLTRNQQDTYFKNVVSGLFDVFKPGQLLFSYFFRDILIGYGGLVHIDWESENAEVSFLLETKRNSISNLFFEDFDNYLKLLSKIAFGELKFNKLHTTFYVIDQRKDYKSVLELNGFVQEARLHKHILINHSLQDVLIYSLFKK